ncbi:YtxH domain-containing protein [Pontibacter chinhatensis]|uniref:YtxH-like protein n=1 Tax=Pontibacter chinhatensis TaxID=1436961 RepID=A0A1I2RT57_9BACT|nr:YtxH domain-containing protein [Pontibacter chinhatensis]SFG41807.1 YtxH-like protein [Pontibacter chinhatensis]
MRTHMECRSLGENKSNYTAQESVRQIRQQSPEHKKSKGKNSSGGSGAVALGLLAGAAAGALAGVLLAPDKGTTMRRKVSDQATKLGGQVNKGYTTTKDKVSDWTSKLKSGNQTDGNAKRSPYEDTGSSTRNANDIPPAM